MGIIPEKKQIEKAQTFFNVYAAPICLVIKAKWKNGYNIKKGMLKQSMNHDFQIGVNMRRMVSFKNLKNRELNY